MRVVVTSEAKADLVEIGEFIRPHSPARAITFVDELLDRCATLADNPLAFLLVPRYEHHGIRRCVHQDYLIFYRVLEDRVEIIHVLHGARNYDALLFPESMGLDVLSSVGSAFYCLFREQKACRLYLA